jgi:hypothetical protein
LRTKLRKKATKKDLLKTLEAKQFHCAGKNEPQTILNKNNLN